MTIGINVRHLGTAAGRGEVAEHCGAPAACTKLDLKACVAGNFDVHDHIAGFDCLGCMYVHAGGARPNKQTCNCKHFRGLSKQVPSPYVRRLHAFPRPAYKMEYQVDS